MESIEHPGTEQTSPDDQDFSFVLGVITRQRQQADKEANQDGAGFQDGMIEVHIQPGKPGKGNGNPQQDSQIDQIDHRPAHRPVRVVDGRGDFGHELFRHPVFRLASLVRVPVQYQSDSTCFTISSSSSISMGFVR